MSDEVKKVFCTQCGSENEQGSKFCRNCGAKLECVEAAPAAEAVEPAESVEAPAEPVAAPVEDATAPADGVFSGEAQAPVYEKITDAEVVPPTPAQDDIQINYGTDNNTYANTSQDSTPQYYQKEEVQKTTNGNKGFAIASLVCGILSLVCCCFTLFSMILGVIAIVLGIITICCKYDGKGMAIAGIATGGVGIFVWIIGLIIGGSAMMKEFEQEIFSDLY